MTDTTPPIILRGIELRYVLTRALTACGQMTVAELVSELQRQGFAVRGRPTKAVSDALRWEMRYDRVRRLGHGLYCRGYIPRSTEHRIITRVIALRESVKTPSDDALWDEILADAPTTIEEWRQSTRGRE